MPETPQQSYDRGFDDALKFIASCFRDAANNVEASQYSDFTNPITGKTFRALVKTGEIHFARKLRDVADKIDEAAKDIQGSPNEPKT